MQEAHRVRIAGWLQRLPPQPIFTLPATRPAPWPLHKGAPMKPVACLLLMSCLLVSCQSTPETKTAGKAGTHDSRTTDSAFARVATADSVVETLPLPTPGIVYQSPDPAELLYQPRICVTDTALYYCFYGFTPGNTPSARLYEYRAGAAAAVVIDSADRPPGMWGHDSTLIIDDCSHALVVHDNALYYHAERNGERVAVRYRPGSGAASVTIGERLPDAVRAQTPWSACTLSSPDGGYLACNDFRSIVLLKRTERFEARAAAVRYVDNLGELYDPSNDDFRATLPGEDEGGEGFEVGGFSWSEDSRRIYFDNYAVARACIWCIDLDTRTVRKIVPDHTAGFPCAFALGGREYVLYTQKNTVRLYQHGSDDAVADPLPRDPELCYRAAWYLVYDSTIAASDSLQSVLGAEALAAFAPYGPAREHRITFEGDGLPPARYFSLRLGSEDSTMLARAATHCGSGDVWRDHEGYSGHSFVSDMPGGPFVQTQIDSFRALLDPAAWPGIAVEPFDDSRLLLLGTCLSPAEAEAARQVADSLGIPARMLELTYFEYDV